MFHERYENTYALQEFPRRQIENNALAFQAFDTDGDEPGVLGTD